MVRHSCVSFVLSCASRLRLLAVFLTTMPSIFQGVYGEPVGIAGLHYFALGIGMTGLSQINAQYIDRIYKYLRSRYGGVDKPEYRLRKSSLASTTRPSH